MDCFYKTLPFPEKKRIHFHLLMQFIHQELKHHQGKKNPLVIIAKQLAEKIMVLCFDELVVTDITDAMLLGRLFDALFKHGICLIATSNVAPDDLYKNGLQRKLFLPTIDLIKQHTTVIHLTSTTDYRLQSSSSDHGNMATESGAELGIDIALEDAGNLQLEES